MKTKHKKLDTAINIWETEFCCVCTYLPFFVICNVKKELIPLTAAVGVAGTQTTERMQSSESPSLLRSWWEQ